MATISRSDIQTRDCALQITPIISFNSHKIYKNQPTEPVQRTKEGQGYARFLVNTQFYWAGKRVGAKERSGEVAIRQEGENQKGQDPGSQEKFM